MYGCPLKFPRNSKSISSCVAELDVIYPSSKEALTWLLVSALLIVRWTDED
jgi:hypothetical protein